MEYVQWPSNGACSHPGCPHAVFKLAIYKEKHVERKHADWLRDLEVNAIGEAMLETLEDPTPDPRPEPPGERPNPPPEAPREAPPLEQLPISLGEPAPPGSQSSRAIILRCLHSGRLKNTLHTAFIP